MQTRSPLRLAAFGLGIAALASCATPGAIGVQDFGMVQGRVVDARSNQPINGAIANVGSLYTTKTDSSGVFQLRVPTGDQTVFVQAAGYTSSSGSTVTVMKDMTVNVDPAIGLQPTTP